jgi:hypothetical protein
MPERIKVFNELKEEFRVKVLKFLPFDFRPALELLATQGDYDLEVLSAMLYNVTTDDGLYLD